MCQEEQLTKDEYHTLLGEAKIVFSANLQETLGISMYEGALVGAIPMVPNRLSYSEMYTGDPWAYPSLWTESFDSYLHNKQELCDRIVHMMDNYDSFNFRLNILARTLSKNFFSATEILKNVI